MKKYCIKIILLLSFPSIALAGGGSNGAKIAQISSMVGGAASMVYAGVKWSQCSWRRNPQACREAIEATKQAAAMWQSASDSYDAAMMLGNGWDGLGFDPNAAGFCFDPSTGCTPDSIDANLSDFGDAFSTGEGFAEAIAKAKQDALDQLKEAEKHGFTVDLEAGTVTDKNGKVTDLSATPSDFPAALSASAASKIAGAKAALGIDAGNSSRKTASNEGSSGGVGSKAGASGLSGLGSTGLLDGLEKGLGSKNKKDNKGKFLAGLSDKDAGRNGVGFAGDDIFNMIQRRYTKKLKSKEFIGK